MADPTAKTLEELLARYTLHPSLCDVYVEGESDKDFFRWFLDAYSRLSVAVYPVTGLSIPAELLLQENLEDNNRARVIFLALTLEERLGGLSRVICIAAADFDHTLGRVSPHRSLLVTDYTSIELYAFRDDVVHKVMRLLGCDEGSGREFLATIQPLLCSLFLVRLVNHVLDLGLHWIQFRTCASISGGTIRFDRGEFLSRYLNTRGMRKELSRFLERLTHYEGQAPADARFRVRGHDFVEVLAWYAAKKCKKSGRLDPELVRRMLMSALSVDILKEHKLFQELLARTAA